MKHDVTLFAIAPLLPVPLLVLGALAGGWWLWAALVYLTLFALMLDELVAIVASPARPETEFPAADWLSGTLAVAHFLLLGLAVWALSGGSGLGAGEKVTAFLAFGIFFGQVSNSNAHELIHRSGRGLHELGKWVFISHLFGHHTSAHRYVHHAYVGTPSDPNTARRGQSFYDFAPRAWLGSFGAGFHAENARYDRASGRPARLHPYTIYVGGALAGLTLSALIGGAAGVFAHIALASYATAQLLMSDYVQHYGLARRAGPDGQPEPFGPQHSWNSPHWFSGLVMLNAARHSDHHNHPARVFPALALPDSCPTLPRSLQVMGVLALFPRHWRRLMDPLLDGLP